MGIPEMPDDGLQVPDGFKPVFVIVMDRERHWQTLSKLPMAETVLILQAVMQKTVSAAFNEPASTLVSPTS